MVKADPKIIRIFLTVLQPFSDILPAIVNNLLIQPVKYIYGRLSNPTRKNHHGGPNLDDPSTLESVEHLPEKQTIASAIIRLNQVDSGHAMEQSKRSEQSLTIFPGAKIGQRLLMAKRMQPLGL
tara:strand:+ start:3037 stop:3408 length:372 start_codon:yes stop_codon:yes gene_type:complete